MKVILNNIIPFKGFVAICLWPFIFVRKSAAEKFGGRAGNHECIHAEQQKEMLVIFFVLWYGFEWCVRCIQYRNVHTAYRNISFEREAYANESNYGYLEERKYYSWIHYIKQKI